MAAIVNQLHLSIWALGSAIRSVPDIFDYPTSMLLDIGKKQGHLVEIIVSKFMQVVTLMQIKTKYPDLPRKRANQIF